MASEKWLIDANVLLQEVDSLTTLIGNPKFDTKRYWHNTGFNGGIVAAKRSIKDAPTVEAVEVVHGRWEPRTDVIGFVRCSVCHDCNIYDDWPDGKKWNYCPNCGAKMDGGNEDV